MSELLHRLDDFSDRLSPIVVKEVRQFVRSREFLASFATSLILALLIAFFASTQSMAGSRTAGMGAFGTLTSCLVILGLAVVPIGAFTTLRSERLEQTLDLISLTTMSPRRIIIGKLETQGVKLVTFFAVMMPFVATSFLLGGIDFVTILTAMVAVFLGSMWVAAAALCASTMFRSRVMSGLLFAVMAVVVFIVFMASRVALTRMLLGIPPGAFAAAPPPSSSWRQWWTFGTLVVFCLATMANLVLLAESRLALATQNRVSVLRAGLFVQFLLILAWTLANGVMGSTYVTQSLMTLMIVGSLHLGVVAAFAVTEGMDAPSQRVTSPEWLRHWGLHYVFGPGGGRAALYVLLQMALFVGTGAALRATVNEIRLMLSICGTICLLTGVPALLVHRFSAAGLGSIHARGMVLFAILLSLILPDFLYYVLWRPEVFALNFEVRHLFSPVLPLFNWDTVQSNGWEVMPLIWAGVGVSSYLWMMRMTGRRPLPIEVASLGLAPEVDPRDGRSR
jgi:hypothetical protein